MDIGLMDAIANALVSAAVDTMSQLQWETTSQVAGALVRLSRKRAGVHHNLANAFLIDAYVDEFTRVVRGWPERGYALLPGPFYTTACWIRQMLVARGHFAPQEPLPPGFLPTIIDSYPAFAVVDGKRWLYASPQWLSLLRVRARDLLNGTIPVGQGTPGVQVVELSHTVVDEHHAPMGSLVVADRSLLPIDLRSFSVSFDAWESLMPAPMRL